MRSIRIVPIALALAATTLAACTDISPSAPAPARDACERLGAAGTYAGDVSLAPGQAMPLATGASLCLAIGGSAADAYALAYVDTRPIEAARTALEPSRVDSFRVTVGGAGSTRGARLVSSIDPSPPSDVRVWDVARAETGDAGGRATPWAAGEAFTLYDPLADSVRPAAVQRVYDGWLVVAAFTDQPEPKLAGMVQNLDAAWPRVRDTGIPLLRKLLSDSLPMTSGGSRQLLVVVRSDMEGAAGVAIGGNDGVRTLTQIALLPYDGASNVPYVTSLLFHEVTHAFQRQYMSATRPAGTPPSMYAGSSTWAIEGGAALMQAELARRLAGVTWASNWDFRAPAGADQSFYTRFALTGRGAFSGGYSPPAGFLRDLADRRVQAGEGVDDALSQVMRGSIEGWFGHGPLDSQRTGLAARMQAVLHRPWEPHEAMLAWTLSHAADDRTPSAEYQDRLFLRAWDSTDPGAWPAAAVLSAGSAPVTLAQARESTGFFELAGGGTYTLASTVEGVRWMLVRLR